MRKRVLMQTKGGGKHDILYVGRATATTLDCLRMRPRDPDTDMCPATETVAVSTEECMAYQSCVRVTRPRYQAVQVERRQARNIAGSVMMKRWRSLW